MIDIITFTGIDKSTDFGRLLDISKQYPKAEFAVLVGDHHPWKNKFPIAKVVSEFAGLDVPKAIHLCQNMANQVTWEHSTPPLLWQIYKNFNRVQINLTTERVVQKHDNILYFADKVGTDKIILQHRSAWENIPVEHEKIEYLFDCSGGRGIYGSMQWPEPTIAMERVGYAGGLGPDTIATMQEFAEKHSQHHIWFDMETRIRTDDWFDLDKVEQVCKGLWP